MLSYSLCIYYNNNTKQNNQNQNVCMHIMLHRIKTEYTVRDFYLAALCIVLVLDFIIAIFFSTLGYGFLGM